MGGGGGGFSQKRHGVVSWGEMTNNKGFFVRVFLGEVRGGVESGGGGGGVFVAGIKLRLLVTETSRNRKKKENRGKIDSHQARLLVKKRKPVEYLL